MCPKMLTQELRLLNFTNFFVITLFLKLKNLKFNERNSLQEHRGHRDREYREIYLNKVFKQKLKKFSKKRIPLFKFYVLQRKYILNK